MVKKNEVGGKNISVLLHALGKLLNCPQNFYDRNNTVRKEQMPSYETLDGAG